VPKLRISVAIAVAYRNTSLASSKLNTLSLQRLEEVTLRIISGFPVVFVIASKVLKLTPMIPSLGNDRRYSILENKTGRATLNGQRMERIFSVEPCAVVPLLTRFDLIIPSL